MYDSNGNFLTFSIKNVPLSYSLSFFSDMDEYKTRYTNILGFPIKLFLASYL